MLAHAIAHEIVHIVTRSDGHSQTGLMKIHWDSADLNRIEVYELEFTENDLLYIQSGFDSYRRRAQSKQ